jgi:uncharacterized protein with GYD domain
VPAVASGAGAHYNRRPASQARSLPLRELGTACSVWGSQIPFPAVRTWTNQLEGRHDMAAYIILGQYSDQGVRSIQETTKRAEAFKKSATKLGVTVKQIFWTLGHYDIVTIAEAPDDETMTALLLSAAKLGNLRTQSLRAFSAEEMGRILGKIA